MNLYAILTLFVISYQASALNVENASLVYKQKYVINNFELKMKQLQIVFHQLKSSLKLKTAMYTRFCIHTAPFHRVKLSTHASEQNCKLIS